MSKIGYIRVSTEHQETARQQEIMDSYTSKPKIVRPVPVNPAHFTTKIGGTTFEVSTHFSDDGRQSVLSLTFRPSRSLFVLWIKSVRKKG